MSNSIRSLYVDIRSNHEKAVAGLRQVDREGDKAARSMEEAEEASNRLAQRQRHLEGALVATAAVATGAALALREIAQVGMEVDQTLSVVETTSGATESQMASMRSEAKELGATMPLAMSEIASGFEQLSYAGYDAEQSIQAIASTSQLAVAGQMDLGQASQIVVSNLNAFQMEADQASSVADGLASTFATSATTIEEASQALEYVSASANSAGQSITQTNAAIGVLADNGMRGSRAGTSMMQMLTSLASPSNKAADALSQVGLSAQSFTDEEGNFKDMTDILRTLGSATEDLPEAERMQVLTDAFGKRGARAVAPLLNNVDDLQTKLEQIAAGDFVGSVEELEDVDPSELEDRLEGLDVTLEPGMDTEEVVTQFADLSDELSQEEMEAEIQAALNVDEDAAEILAADIEAGEAPEEIAAGLEEVVSASDLVDSRMNTLAGQFEYVRGSIEAFAYTAYEALEPMFMLGGGALVNLVDLLNENENVAKAFGLALLGLGGAAGVAAAAIAATIVQLKGAAFWQSAVASETIAYRAAQYASAAATKANALAQMGLRGALMATAGGFKAAALAAKGFLTSLGPVGWALIAGSVALSAYMSNAFGLKDAIDQLLSPLGSFLGFLWDITSSGVGAVIDGILAPFRAIGSVISTVIETGTDLLAWFDSLGPVGRAPLVMIATAINPVLGGFLMLRNVLSYIGPAAEVAGNAIRALGRGGLWLLKTVFWPLIAAGKGVVQVGQWIAGGLSAAAGAYADFTGAIESGPGRALTATLDAIGGASAWVGDQLSKLAGATETFFRVLSLFTPMGLVYWLTQAATGSEDLAAKFGPLEPIMSKVFGAARFVGGALRELYDIGQLFGDWIIGRAIGWLNSQVDAARAKFDSFKQGVYEALDPFVQLYNWMQRIIDKVPDLPSKEDIPLVGGFLGDGGGEVTDANASAEEEGAGFARSAWDSVAGDALPSVDEMRAETEQPTPGDIEESRVTGPEDREAPESPEAPEAPEAPQSPEAPAAPAEPETPVQPETQGVDSPMDAADPYAEGQQAGEQTAEGMATGIDRRMEIARQSAAEMNQGVQEETSEEITGPDVRPGEQFDPESMPEQTPPDQEREVQTTDQRRVEYRETGGLESVPDPEPAEGRVETSVESPEQPEQPTYDEYRVGTEVQTPQEPEVQTDQEYTPAHQPPDAEAPAIPEAGNYEPGVETPEPESPDLQTDEDRRIDVEAAMAQEPTVETDQEYEPDFRPPEAQSPELPQSGTFEPSADTSEIEQAEQALQSFHETSTVDAGGLPQEAGEYAPTADTSEVEQAQQAMQLLQETTDEDLDVGELDAESMSDARDSVQAFRDALPGGTYEDEFSDVLSTLHGELSQFGGEEFTPQMGTPDTQPSVEEINSALDTVEEKTGIEIDREELSAEDIQAATESMRSFNSALPTEGGAEEAAGGIMAIHDRYERLSEGTYEPEVKSPDVTPPEIPEAQTMAEDYEPGFVEPEADPSFETDQQYEPGVEEPEVEGPTSMPDRSPEVTGRTGYTPAVEAEPETPSVESATIENAAEGSDRARQFFPETTTDEEGETQEVYQEVPDTVAEMPPDLRDELRARNTEEGEGAEQPPAPESPSVDVDPAESPDVAVSSNPEVAAEQPDVQAEVQQPGPAQRGTASPQQPESPQGPAMAAAGGGQAAVAAGATDAGPADAYQDLPDPRAESMRGVADRPPQTAQEGQSPSVEADVSRSPEGVSVDLTVDQNITLHIDSMESLVDSDELEQFGRELQDRTETAVENGLLDSLDMTPQE